MQARGAIRTLVRGALPKRTVQWIGMWRSLADNRLLRLPHSWLVEVGWRRSIVEGRPIDAEGHPLPWLTYAAIAFLRDRAPPGSSVWEWGSGHSTIWWLERGCCVTSCEHDAAWAELVTRMAGGRAEVLRRPLDEGYVTAIHEAGQAYDIVLIDGEPNTRRACAEACLGALGPDGVIVMDNTNEPYCQTGLEFLMSKGFKRIDFEGLGPAIVYGWTTSVLYRDGNRLGI